MMKLHKIFILILASVTFFSACSLFEPEDDNHSTADRILKEPNFAEGLLIRAYTFIPTNDYRWDEVATDDAVSNDKVNNYMRMATGEWSALFNPQNLWDNSNQAIIYINNFLDVVDEVPFKWTDKKLNDLYVRRLKGESYALRGLFKYYLLRNHGGIGANDQLLGTPIYNEFIQTLDEFSRPRPGFNEGLASAYADIDEALKYIPLDYGDLPNLETLPAGFGEITNIDDYNAVFGNFTQQRISGRIAKAIKARLALLAASPAFNPTDDMALWQNAANFHGELLADIGGIAGLDPTGHEFYLKPQVDRAWITTGNRIDLPEMLWRRPIYTNRTREVDNFPPSLYGNGRINPTQNLVDAFPMANGYPINHPNSGYDPANPYQGRDPRLNLYIVVDGSSLRNTVIRTGADGGENGIEGSQNATRTGYYLKKLLREDVNANPSSPSDQQHFNTHIRYTELFLNYAEAANEAWGPDAPGSWGISARQVVEALRERAGIAQPDEYLMSVAGKDEMRELIRNERRLELCFESHRFWDLRRWKADLTVPARGVLIDGSNFNYFTVEERAYNNSYMHYGPIPDKEIVKFGLIQNKGWN
jgi:hypothetical protein